MRSGGKDARGWIDITKECWIELGLQGQALIPRVIEPRLAIVFSIPNVFKQADRSIIIDADVVKHSWALIAKACRNLSGINDNVNRSPSVVIVEIKPPQAGTALLCAAFEILVIETICSDEIEGRGVCPSAIFGARERCDRGIAQGKWRPVSNPRRPCGGVIDFFRRRAKAISKALDVDEFECAIGQASLVNVRPDLGLGADVNGNAIQHDPSTAIVIANNDRFYLGVWISQKVFPATDRISPRAIGFEVELPKDVAAALRLSGSYVCDRPTRRSAFFAIQKDAGSGAFARHRAIKSSDRWKIG